MIVLSPNTVKMNIIWSLMLDVVRKISNLLKTRAGQFNSVNHNTFEGTLLAIQGPKAQEILQQFTNEDLSKIYFGQTKFLKLSPIGATVHLARSGYTGEDGFELSIPSTTPEESKQALDFLHFD